jgi:hypothetical protein
MEAGVELAGDARAPLGPVVKIDEGRIREHLDAPGSGVCAASDRFLGDSIYLRGIYPNTTWLPNALIPPHFTALFGSDPDIA